LSGPGDEAAEGSRGASGYDRIIEHVFMRRYSPGAEEVHFARDDLVDAAKSLGPERPKNVGDILYTYRYRRDLPCAIMQLVPPGKQTWLIRGTGRAHYCFVAVATNEILPREMLAAVKVPDSTPGLIAQYALSDEQALLARVRYNRLVDLFTGVTCYSLQNHLRTSIPGLGQIETDEVYVGIHADGAQFIIPVQAKGGSDRLSVVQIMQDFDMCRAKFRSLECLPVAAQFMPGGKIALFSFAERGHEVVILSERHYQLVPPHEISEDDLREYRRKLPAR